jgi:hypothetical protein
MFRKEVNRELKYDKNFVNWPKKLTNQIPKAGCSTDNPDGRLRLLVENASVIIMRFAIITARNINQIHHLLVKKILKIFYFDLNPS